MTVAELKFYIGTQLVAPVTLVEKFINCYNAVIDFVSQSTTNGIPTWSSALTFNLDGSGVGAYCTVADSEGTLRFWKSKTNGNTNNLPPTDPDITFNTYWEEVSPASGSAIKEHAPGFFGNGLIIVMYDDGNSSGLYKLNEATRPFNSTNFITERAAGKWVLFSPIVTKANLAAFPAAGTAAVLYIAADTNLIYRWTGAAYVQTGGGVAPNLDAVLTTGNSAAGKRISNLLNPVSAQDADTMAARDAAITSALEGIKWKQSVRVATTVNITLTAPQTIDGIAVVAGNRVLVKNQTTQTQNGIYVCAAGAWSRALDGDTSAELTNAVVPVEEGTSNADTTWRQTADGITLGSSNILFAAFGGSVPDATTSVKGIAKLYTDLTAKNTDGSVTQAAAVNATQQPDAAAATAAGTNTYTATIAPAITAYVANQRFYIKFTNGNTASATLNLNALGAKTIKKNSSDNLGVGDIVAGAIVELVYDGTNFQAIGLTKVLETAVGNLQQDSVTISIYKESNFGTP